MRILNFIKRGYAHYWYTGYKQIAILGLLLGLFVNFILFIMFTDFSNTIKLIIILLLEKQFMIFVIAYYIFFKEIFLNFILDLLPKLFDYKFGIDMVYKKFDKIDQFLTNFIIENILLLIVSILLSRFLLNFIANRYYKFDIHSKIYNKE